MYMSVYIFYTYYIYTYILRGDIFLCFCDICCEVTYVWMFL